MNAPSHGLEGHPPADLGAGAAPSGALFNPAEVAIPQARYCTWIEASAAPDQAGGLQAHG